MTVALHTTTDPYLAGYLYANGARLDHCRRLGPKKVAYRFVASRRLHGLLRLYWSGQTVPMVPGHFAASLQKLKCMRIFRTR